MPQRSDTRRTAPRDSAWKRALAGQWWFVSGFWLVLTLALMLAESLEYPRDVNHALRVAGTRYFPWVILTPAISWLISGYPLQWISWRRSIGLYLAACVIVITGLGALAYYIEPFPRNDGANFPRRPRDARTEPPAGLGVRNNSSLNPSPDGSPRGIGRPARNQRSATIARLIRVASLQLPTFWLVVLALHGLRFYQEARDRERHEAELESSLAEARLQTLRMQLNPHFLFNTLNSIASLVYENPKGADEMISALSDLLRLTLKSQDQQETSLRGELHFLELFLRIEQARFGDRLKLQKEIEPAALDAMVPIFILQPLAENAVKHGLEKQLGPFVMSVAARRAADDLLVQFTDNGRGPTPTAAGRIEEGVGIGNTRARLHALHGDKALMEIRRQDIGGCLVEIKIPWRTELSPEPHPEPSSVA